MSPLLVARACAAYAALAPLALLADPGTPEPDAAPATAAVARFNYQGDTYTNVAGGLARGAGHVSRLDVGLEGSLERLVGWPGARAQVRGLVVVGEAPNALVGSRQGVSNIEAPTSLRVYEAWLEQELGGALTLRAGLCDLNAEFDVIDAGAPFLNPSHGIGMDLSQTGRHGPSIFPLPGLALRAAYASEGGAFARAAAFDADPGDPAVTSSDPGRYQLGEGLLAIAEAGWKRPEGAADAAGLRKVAAGAWGYTAPHASIGPGSAAEAGATTPPWNAGAYVLGEVALGAAGAPTLYGRAGLATPRINATQGYLGTGLAWPGPFDARPGDLLGIALAVAVPCAEVVPAVPSAVGASEAVLELSYRAAIGDTLALQPDVQLVRNPGNTGLVPDALFVALRVELLLDSRQARALPPTRPEASGSDGAASRETLAMNDEGSLP